MNREDMNFLKELQNQMLTQDNFNQANPRFWVIRQKNRIYGLRDGFDIDGVEAILNGEKIAQDFKELAEYLMETDDSVKVEFYKDEIEEYAIIENDGDKKHCSTIYELAEYMTDELGYDEDLYLVNYRDEYFIAENTMFLTFEECKRHIERNGYHYNEPHPYAMTAWRSPQVERLYKILENTNWDELEK